MALQTQLLFKSVYLGLFSFWTILGHFGLTLPKTPQRYNEYFDYANYFTVFRPNLYIFIYFWAANMRFSPKSTIFTPHLGRKPKKDQAYLNLSQKLLSAPRTSFTVAG